MFADAKGAAGEVKMIFGRGPRLLAYEKHVTF